MTTQHTEVDLIAAMARATTLTEQREAAEALTAFRNARREEIQREGSLDWDAMREVDLRPTFVSEPVTAAAIGSEASALDWLEEVVPAEHDLDQVSATMRAEATLWFESLWEPVKKDPVEFPIQAKNAARRIGSRFGYQADQAASVFVDHARHLHTSTGHTAAWGEEVDPKGEPTQPPPYHIPQGSDLPNPTNKDTFDGIVNGENGATEDPKTETSDSPSLKEGESPEQDKPADGVTPPVKDEDTQYVQDNSQGTTYTDPMPSGGKGNAATGSKRTAIHLSNVGFEDRAKNLGKGTDPNGNKVVFKMSDKEASDLAGVLYSDLAGNFSGVDVDEADIVKGSAKTAGRYCTTHQVWVGEGNADTHSRDSCHVEQRKTEKSSSAFFARLREVFAYEPPAVSSGTDKPDYGPADTSASGDPKTDLSTANPSLKEGDQPEGDKSEPFVKPEEPAQDKSTWGKDPDSLSTGGEDGSNAAGGAKIPGTPTHSSLRGLGVAIARQAATDNTRIFGQALATMSSLTEQRAGFSGAEIVAMVLASGDVSAEHRAALEMLAGEVPEAFKEQWNKGSGDDSEKKDEDSDEKDEDGSGKSQPPWLNEDGSKKESAAEGQTCAVCGDKIAQDPAGEDPSTWHHDNGEKHDHEAKPSGESKEGRRDPFAREAAEQSRPLYEIARDIRRNWPDPYFGAVPYIDALGQLSSLDDRFYEDTGRDIVAYLVSNMRYWRGPEAARIKGELKALLGRRASKTADHQCPACEGSGVLMDQLCQLCQGSGRVEGKQAVTAAEYQGGSPKAGDTATCHCGKPIEFFDGSWYHLSKDGPVDWDSHGPGTYPGKKASVQTLAAQSTEKTPGRWVAEVLGTGEAKWARNSLTFDTREEAAAYARDLSGRWFGMDVARVRQIPEGGLPPSLSETFDPADPDIVVNYRTGSRRSTTAGTITVFDPKTQRNVQVRTGTCRTCGGPALEYNGQAVHDPREPVANHPAGSVAGDAHAVVLADDDH